MRAIINVQNTEGYSWKPKIIVSQMGSRGEYKLGQDGSIVCDLTTVVSLPSLNS